MDAPIYVNILEQTFLPFISQVHPDRHRRALYHARISYYHDIVLIELVLYIRAMIPSTCPI